MGDAPDIRRLISRILITVFTVALLAGVGTFYVLLYDEALRNAQREARIMLASADAVGEYTAAHILPKLSALPAHDFYQEMVPFYASQTVFRSVSGAAQLYTFRDPALNPTNPNDRPEPFDVEVIRRFRQDKTLPEVFGVRDTGVDKLFFLARPIRVSERECLTCHSTPDRAPAAMVARYGQNGGFGWELGETVGVQMLTVPLTEPLRGTVRLVAILALGLLAVFLVAYLALSTVLDAMVVRPLAELARVADQQSLSAAAPMQAPQGGVREIRLLSSAIERLRTSLAKALSALNGPAGPENGRS